MTEISRADWIRHRALHLQSEGPDEFPFGYYLNQAEDDWEKKTAPRVTDETRERIAALDLTSRHIEVPDSYRDRIK